MGSGLKTPLTIQGWVVTYALQLLQNGEKTFSVHSIWRRPGSLTRSELVDDKIPNYFLKSVEWGHEQIC
jgi:hypothetical protein